MMSIAHTEKERGTVEEINKLREERLKRGREHGSSSFVCIASVTYMDSKLNSAVP